MSQERKVKSGGHDWLSPRSPEDSLVIIRALTSRCAELGGVYSRHLNAIAQSDDFVSLMSHELNYDSPNYAHLGTTNHELLSYNEWNINDLVYSRQILGFFQKSQFLDFEGRFNRSEAAALRFVEAERMCRDSNRRFKSLPQNPSLPGPDVSVMLHYAQRKIADVLGGCPGLGDLPFSFGPGANTNVKGAYASPRLKLGAPLECSSNMSPTVQEFLYETPEWAALHDTKVSHDTFVVNVTVAPGKVMFVPKNAKTDRSICVEPLLNSFFQKGFGTYIRDRLASFNVFLKDQTRNQKLAHEASVGNRLATVDLSMASDCISRELVWNLLPYDWAEVLDRLRTSVVVLPRELDLNMINHFDMAGTMELDKPYYLEKFSSMGNGFTFELESLIFYGLCVAACTHVNEDISKIAVYGDDLIVPSKAFIPLVTLLSFCGFNLNKDKSFADGKFRESCGSDYFAGFDIRPFYLKEQISERQLYLMHNWFLRHGEYQLADLVKSFVHPDLALYGPDGFGDGHLIGDFNLRINRSIKRSGWDGGYFDTYALTPRRFCKPSPGDAILPTYSVYTRSGKDSLTDPNVVRGSKGYAKISIYTLERSIFSRKA